MSVVHYTGQAIVASWHLPLLSVTELLELVKALLRRGWNCTALHLDINAPCYVRVLIVEGRDPDDLRAEIADVIHGFVPQAAVETRIEVAS